MDLMAALMHGASHDDAPKIPVGEKLADVLKERLAILKEEHTFKVGDLVKVKDGIGSQKEWARRSIVIETDQEKVAAHIVGRRYEHGEPAAVLDMIVASLTPGGFELYPGDSRYYEPWDPAQDRQPEERAGGDVSVN